VTEEEVFSFARNTIRSVWALELLLLLHKTPARSWRARDLVRELRSSDAVIAPCLDGLKAAGLAGDDETGWRYAPATQELDTVTGELAKIYATKPMALAKAIMRAPNEKLTIFSDAFKLKGDE
jgi:DNA-binding IclR family transcriptional regulator